MNNKFTYLKFKPYLHFDLRISPFEHFDYIFNKDKIKSHSFYPFLYYPILTRKYDGDEVKIKTRDIYYSAHMDRYIYEHYAHKLNKLYEKIILKEELNSSIIAYRSNLHKSNIDFAFDTFKKINKAIPCYVICSDFSKFFEKLDHQHLKCMIKKVLNLDELPEDYYNIFKSITKYSYVERGEVFKLFDIPLFKTKNYLRICDPINFRKRVKPLVKKHNSSLGIPQGSPISATLSNIYMLDFDINLYQKLKKIKACFKRYSDDIIIIAPIEHKDYVKELFVQLVKDYPGIEVNSDKTEEFCFLPEIVSKNKNKNLDYLGFTFDGKTIKIRDRSIFKYYKKLHKAINIINFISDKEGKNIGRKRLYDRYSHLGAKKSKKDKKRKLNFLSYVYRSSKIMKSKSIKNQIKNHWKTIHKRLLTIQ